MPGHTRWYLFMAFVLVLVLTSAIWIALGVLFPAPPSRITIAGSFSGGHFEALAQRYQETLARSGLKVNVLPTAGSVDNLISLQDPRLGVDVAFVQGGISDGQRAPGLLSLGRIDYQVFWLFSRGQESLSDLTQLRGRRIALGPVGSGARIVCETILRAGGVTYDNASFFNFAPQEAVDALEEGRVDALFLNFAPDSSSLMRLLNNPDYRLVNMTDAEALTRIFPYLVKLVMPRGVVDFERKIPASDVNLIGTTNVVLVRDDLHPAIIDLLAKTIAEVHGTAGIFQRAGEFPSVADPEYPVAEEAREYYRNGPSFLNRYLPFWVTNIVKRLLALALAAIAIILPIFSYGPSLYKWLIEYRLRALYRRLRNIEERLHKGLDAAQIAALEEEVELLEHDMIKLALPVRHSNLYFSVKSHLNLVRIRIRSRLESSLRLKSETKV
jgi:TRAP transporter TAXI family solute receptor